MDSILCQFIEAITLILQENPYGELKLLSSRTKKTSHFIDKIITSIIEQVRILENSLRFKLYNIKIFTEDSCNLEIRKNIPILARFYNYLLLNTNFLSQHLLRNDIRFGYMVGICPTLSVYLFIQIIWHLKCEDLLVESLVHIPLDLCVQILETTFKHINELQFPRARRLAFLLIYKVYYKCLWLHLGTLSEQNVMERVHQLITYFDKLLDFLVNPIFVSSPTSCINEKYLQHGILVKNMLHYIRKCMHSKIENYWENCNLAASFTLTYGNFNEYTNYYHVLPVGEVKSIITTLDQKLINLLVNQIKHIETSEYIVWENTVDDEITTISLQQGIAMECHYFTEFAKQNKCFMTNEELFPYLKRLVDPKKSEESILTLQELCRKITDGRLHDMRELIKRYKEWDLSILDFINEKIELLKIYDVSVILEYVHYIFPYLHTNAKKYRVCVSVLKILIQLTVNDLHYVVQNYVEQHFDDNPLEYLYNEKCFIEFIERSSFIEPCEMTELVRTQELCTLLTYILLNPKEVLSKIVMYEIDVKFSHDFMFEENMSLVRSYYTLKSNECNVLMYILKDMIFVQRIILCSRFIDFMDNVLSYQMITADEIINELYVIYLVRNCLEETNTVIIILLHMYSTVKRGLLTYRTNFMYLIIALLKTMSLLRRGNKTFSKVMAYERGDIINNILWNLRILNTMPIIRYYINSNSIEPLEMKNLFPSAMNIIEIIQEYEKRCFVMHQRLRTDRRCHPKLRNYVESFNLDRQSFIRHIILYCFKIENEMYGLALTLIFFRDFGWANEMIAYENIMQISAEALQIALMNIESFSKNTFVMLLHSIISFSNKIENFMPDNNQKEVRRILLKTLSSTKDVVGEKRYKLMYNFLLKYVYHGNPSYLTGKYNETSEWIYALIHGYVPCTISLIDW